MRKFKHIDLIILGIITTAFLVINVRMNLFNYSNFDFGKFDLGNMSQMLWNTLHGRFMYLTDYFGTNLPRWAMSHVDPILLLFLPIYVFFQHSLTLAFAQLVIVLFASFIVYAISLLELRSKFASLLIALAYLSYPALGFLTAKTGFHGVTAAIPFFLLAFYYFERMYHQASLSKKYLVLFWIFLVIALTGKEQISLYVFLFGIFIMLFRSPQIARKAFMRLGLTVSVIGALWFYIAFFVIIPHYASYRVEGYKRFAVSLGIEDSSTRDVGLENYFLSRYDAFGDSYTAIVKNIILHPSLAVNIFFGGDKIDNFAMTFAPVMYLPFVAPQILVMAVPDLMMNYLTSAGGIGTSEIQNHRISMIIPVLFLAVIFSFAWIKGFVDKYPRCKLVFYVLPIALLASNIYFSFKYENVVFLWTRDAVSKRFPVFIASAKTDADLAGAPLKIGDVNRISALENKDRECAVQIVKLIPDGVSVSGPDYLGAHLAQRETFAIFPALFNEADYVIVDVFSKKILTILELDTGLIKNIVNKIIRDPNYQLEASCGNLFVYKRVGEHQKSDMLPIQERFRYPASCDFEIYGGLTVVDYALPKQFNRGEIARMQLVYLKKNSLSSYFLFTSFVNEKTGDLYQAANLPSFAISEPQDWNEGYYYIEDLEVVLPTYLDSGTYRVFIGMTNYVKTRSVYLGDVEVK